MNQSEFNDDEIESPIDKIVSVAYVIILSQRKPAPNFLEESQKCVLIDLNTMLNQ